MSEQREADRQADQFLLTEHTALQTARSATIFDSNGRATQFLTAVSSALVALAFIGQVSNVGTAFFVFALILFPTLMFLGFATFHRVLQSGIEDMFYARGINRIRHYYIERAPQSERYFIQSSSDDPASVFTNMAIGAGRWQLFLSTAGTVGVIDSVLGGVFVGLLVYVVAQMLAVAGLVASIVAGAIAFVALVVLHHQFQIRTYLAVVDNVPVLFPSDQTPPSQSEASHDEQRAD